MRTFDEIVELWKTKKCNHNLRALIKCWIEKYDQMMKSKLVLVEQENINERAIKFELEQNEYILKRYEVEYGYNVRCLEMLEKQIFT
jgi:hypothetical protein